MRSTHLVARIPGARLVELPDAAHMGFITHHTRYRRELADFLTALV